MENNSSVKNESFNITTVYPRKMINLNQNEEKISGISFKVMSYNTLAQSSIRRNVFDWCSEKALKWAYRKTLLITEIKNSGSDIICLQECDSHFYKEFWNPTMLSNGFQSVYKANSKSGNHGCAIFFNTNKFEQVKYEEMEYSKMSENYEGTAKSELNCQNVGQVLALKCKGNESKGLIISNTHLFWNWKYEFVRIKQAMMLLEKVNEWRKELGYSVVMCGDFNMNPNSHAYHFLTTHTVHAHKKIRY